jgi:hypothetical protein
LHPAEVPHINWHKSPIVGPRLSPMEDLAHTRAESGYKHKGPLKSQPTKFAGIAPNESLN